MACLDSALDARGEKRDVMAVKMCKQPERLLDFEACFEAPEEGSEWERNGLLWSKSNTISRASSMSDSADGPIPTIGGRRLSAQSSTTAGTDTAIKSTEELDRIKERLLNMNKGGTKARSPLCSGTTVTWTGPPLSPPAKSNLLALDVFWHQNAASCGQR